MPRISSVAALFAGLFLLQSCGGSGTGDPTKPDDPEPSNITVEPNNASLDAVGATIQYQATVRDQLGREMPGEPVSWSTSSPAVASITSGGLATAWVDGAVTVGATAGGGKATGSATLTVAIVDLSITTAALSPGVTGLAYSQTLEASVSTVLAWSVIAGALPDGLSLAGSTGVISGTPTTPGVSDFTVQVSIVGGQTATKDLSITVVSGNLGIGFDDDQFVLIPVGSFQMGSNNGGQDERPVHQVNITQPFYIQKTEVTQAQWMEIMGYNPSSFASCGETCPVERVSWNEVQTFIEALNVANPGANFRLPTEAEWEFAARAGTTGDYGGTGILHEMGWYSGNSSSKTRFVGLKQPNAWGLYDMHGNVFEWVNDWYSAGYYGVSPADNPPGPDEGTQKVMRGGSVDRGATDARSAERRSGNPASQGFTIYYGFRLARTPS